MKRHGPTPGKVGWSQSAQFRAIGRAAIRAWNATRDQIPRCGAKRKSDGAPCRQWPMQNGRCYLHGGRTPSGDQWHRLQPLANGRKLEAKLNKRDRALKRQAARIAAMTPEERTAYKRWLRTHRPGLATIRAAERELRRQALDAAKLLSGSGKGDAKPKAAVGALAEMIDALRQRAKRLKDEGSECDALPFNNVFD